MTARQPAVLVLEDGRAAVSRVRATGPAEVADLLAAVRASPGMTGADLTGEVSAAAPYVVPDAETEVRPSGAPKVLRGELGLPPLQELHAAIRADRDAARDTRGGVR